jgi:hypothetical protein
MYFSVAAIAAILMMSINLNANMNSNMNAYATIMSEIPNVDDIGQSAECVIVVVGCDGTGSVGSSGDTIIGGFNGNNDNNTNDNGGPPLSPVPSAICVGCIDATPIDLRASIAHALGLDIDATTAEICLALDALTNTALIHVLLEAGLTPPQMIILLECLGRN